MGTVGGVTRYTPPSDDDQPLYTRPRSRRMRFGVWVLLLGVVALVFADIAAAFL